MERLLQDLRYACRALRHRPGVMAGLAFWSRLTNAYSSCAQVVVRLADGRSTAVAEAASAPRTASAALPTDLLPAECSLGFMVTPLHDTRIDPALVGPVTPFSQLTRDPQHTPLPDADRGLLMFAASDRRNSR